MSCLKLSLVRVFILPAFAVCFIPSAFACSSGDTMGIGGAGGAGGDTGSSSSFVASSSAAHSSSAKATSSSSGDMDGGVDGEGGCSTCIQVLNGVPTHEDALHHLCAGTEAQLSWAGFVSCACANGGSCSSDCKATPFCDAVFKDGGAWVDPAGTCSTCLKVDSGTGCGAFALQCTKT